MFISSLGILFSTLVQFCLPTATERARLLAAEETNGLFSEAAHHKQRPNLDREEELFYSDPEGRNVR